MPRTRLLFSPSAVGPVVVCAVLAAGWVACDDRSDGVGDAPTAESASPEVAALGDEYVSAVLRTFPARATAAGLHEHDDLLPDLGPEGLERWIETNRSTAARARRLIADGGLVMEDRHDLELLRRQAELRLFELEVQQIQHTDPLFWSGLLSGSHTHLLVRDDVPLDRRLRSVAARLGAIPRLASPTHSARPSSVTSTITST